MRWKRVEASLVKSTWLSYSSHHQFFNWTSDCETGLSGTTAAARPWPRCRQYGRPSGGEYNPSFLRPSSASGFCFLASVVRAALYFAPGRGTLQVVSATPGLSLTVPGSGTLQRAVLAAHVLSKLEQGPAKHFMPFLRNNCYPEQLSGQLWPSPRPPASIISFEIEIFIMPSSRLFCSLHLRDYYRTKSFSLLKHSCTRRILTDSVIVLVSNPDILQSWYLYILQSLYLAIFISCNLDILQSYYLAILLSCNLDNLKSENLAILISCNLDISKLVHSDTFPCCC